MNTAEQVALLEGLLHKVRTRARHAGQPLAAAAEPAPVFAPTSIPVAPVVSAYEGPKSSVPAPILFRGARVANVDVARFQGQLRAGAPPRSFGDCA